MADRIVKLSDTVNFQVAYTKEFKGKKHLEDGKVVTLHRLVAERLEKKGIGKIAK